MKGDTIARVRRQQALRARHGIFWPKSPQYGALKDLYEADKTAKMRRRLDAMQIRTQDTVGALSKAHGLVLPDVC